MKTAFDHLIPPKLKQNYPDLKLVAETNYYKVYEGKSFLTGQKHAVRLLDIESEFFKKDKHAAATLFVQELLRLSSSLDNSDALLIENFEIFEDKIGFVMKPYHSLQKELEMLAQHGRTTIDLDKLVRSVVSDLTFLTKKMKLSPFGLYPKNIFRVEDPDAYFVADYVSPWKDDSKSSNKKIPVELQPLFAFKATVLEFAGQKQKEWDEAFTLNQQDSLESLLASLGKKFDKPKESDSSQKASGSTKHSAPRIELLPETKVAWSSAHANKVSLYDLQSNRQAGAFDGVQLANAEGYYTYVENFPNTPYLISLSHNEKGRCANFTVHEVTSKITTVFESEEIAGGVGRGDISCNVRSNTAALLPVRGLASYHLFDCRDMQITRKALWQDHHKANIESLSMDPDGRRIATLDWNGLCLISSVENDEYLFHLKMGGAWSFNRCRWSPAPENPLIATKVDRSKLNLIDPEKQTTIHLDAIDILPGCGYTYWIDWRKDGNLIACANSDQSVRIFDAREGQIVKSFENLHNGIVSSVKWSPTAKLLASAGADKIVRILDFNTEKVIYSGETADGCN